MIPSAMLPTMLANGVSSFIFDTLDRSTARLVRAVTSFFRLLVRIFFMVGQPVLTDFLRFLDCCEGVREGNA
jgi:hypothetical protein